MSKGDRVLLDRLAKTLRGIPADRIEQALRKSESVQIRITRAEKDGMKRVARFYRLSVTEYLTRLHAMVETVTLAEVRDQKQK